MFLKPKEVTVIFQNSIYVRKVHIQSIGSLNNIPTVSSTQDLLMTSLNAKFKWAYHTNSDRN